MFIYKTTLFNRDNLCDRFNLVFIPLFINFFYKMRLVRSLKAPLNRTNVVMTVMSNNEIIVGAVQGEPSPRTPTFC